jgi:hypothetical protein
VDSKNTIYDIIVIPERLIAANVAKS